MSRISDEQAELLLSDLGSSGGAGPELREVASFVRALPAAIPVRPDHAVEGPLVQQLAATARSATQKAHGAATAQIPAAAPARAWRRRLVLFGRVAIAVAMVPAALAGLAIAGVSLPDPAREAFERVGIELPNQSEVDDGTPAGAGADGEKGSRAEDGRDAKPAGGGEGESALEQGQQPGDGGGAPSHGKRAHGQNGESQGGGPASTPPGHGATPPGQGGVPPGQGGPPPGHEVPPGQSDTAPGHTGTTPSQGGAPPGQGGVPPGQAKPKKPK
jgi:hypothetical protein